MTADSPAPPPVDPAPVASPEPADKPSSQPFAPFAPFAPMDLKPLTPEDFGGMAIDQADIRKMSFGDDTDDDPADCAIIYVIGSSLQGVVKIGRTAEPERRLNQIQRMSPIPIHILWSTAGGSKMEARLHRAFSHRRVYGEWFDFSDANVVDSIEGVLRRGKR